MNIFKRLMLSKQERWQLGQRNVIDNERDQLFDALSELIGDEGKGISLTGYIVSGGLPEKDAAKIMDHITRKRGGVAALPAWGEINRKSLIELRAHAIAYGVRLRDEYVSPSGKTSGRPLDKFEVERATRRAVEIRKKSPEARAAFTLNEGRAEAARAARPILTPWQVRGFIKRSRRAPSP